MTTELHIRPFTPADQRAARALILAGLGERFGFVDETLNPDLDDITARFLAHRHAFLIAEQAGEVVATGGLIFEPEGDVCQLVRISVRRELRRQGVARAIVAALLALARERGCQRVWVETHEPWHDAIALYERMGFSAYARHDGQVFLALQLAG